MDEAQLKCYQSGSKSRGKIFVKNRCVTENRRRCCCCGAQSRVLTFGMIPHIIQERRAENNIHHTGRITVILVDAEKMWGGDWPFGCLLDNLSLRTGGGRRGYQGPTRCWGDVMTSTADSPIVPPHLSTSSTAHRKKEKFTWAWNARTGKTVFMWIISIYLLCQYNKQKQHNQQRLLIQLDKFLKL